MPVGIAVFTASSLGREELIIHCLPKELSKEKIFTSSSCLLCWLIGMYLCI